MKQIIAFYPELAIELGDITTAIYYQQLMFWSNKGKRKDGYVYKTKKEIQEETTIPPRTQDRHRAKLEELGWLETKLIPANGKPTVHYKTLKDIEIAIHAKVAHNTRQSGAKGHAKVAHSITEITTENTHILASKLADKSFLQEKDPVNSLLSAFTQINPHTSFGNKTQRQYAKKLIDTYGLETMIGNVKVLKDLQDKNTPYLPLITTPYQMYTKWANLINFFKNREN